MMNISITKKLIGLLLLLAISASCWAMGETTQLTARNPVFAIGLEASPNNLVVDAALQPALWTILNKFTINQIFLDAQDAIVSDQKQLGAFIANAHQQEMKVVLYCGRPDWVYKHVYPLETAGRYMAYNESHPAEQRFDGILYHVRFDKLEDWTKDQAQLQNKYFTMLQKVKYKLAYDGITTPLLVALPKDLYENYKKSEHAKLADGVVILGAEHQVLKMKADSSFELGTSALPPI
ncbi:MAG: hypothetical protein WC838_02620 [Candidatus Margulisiibacteriota bacterium]|jgi:hypothetical protein